LAEEKIDLDGILEASKTQPRQSQAVLYSIIKLYNKTAQEIETRTAYEFYLKVCEQAELKPLTQRRVSDLIFELDMLGIINAKVVSKGRYGRTRKIKLSMHTSALPHVITTLERSLFQ
jgi:cell division control protein 6